MPDVGRNRNAREIIRGASGLADLITEMDSSEALILGDHVAEGTTIRLLNDSEADPAQGLYGRTLATFRSRPGEPVVEAAFEAAAEELAGKRSIPIAKARTIIAASTSGELLSWDAVHFADDALGVVEVGDILADPKRYHGEALADPVEGRDYGRGKCKLCFNGGGSVVVNSFAHGGGVCQLRHCPDYVASRIEEAGEDAPNVLARLAPFAGGIHAVTRERLRDLAAKVGKVGKRAVNEIFEQAQAKARKEKKEHRARRAPRGDGKPKEADRGSICWVVSGWRHFTRSRPSCAIPRTSSPARFSAVARPKSCSDSQTIQSS